MSPNRKVKKVNDEQVPESPYKREKFKAFLKTLEEGGIKDFESWNVYAEALGVVPETLVRWKKHPKARKARARGISKALNKMKVAGRDDWRMWRDLLKMYGVKDTPQEKHEHMHQHNEVHLTYKEALDLIWDKKNDERANRESETSSK